jgi:hypothetical protein
MATKPTISPSNSPSPSLSGNTYPPIPHVHDFASITGLRFGTDGRVEPEYDSADVYANGSVIALYNAAQAKAAFAPTAVTHVTLIDAVQNNDAPTTGNYGSVTEGPKAAQGLLSEGKITPKQYKEATSNPTPSGAGTPPPAQTNAQNLTGAASFGTNSTFTFDTVLTPKGTTLGQMINKVTFPRTIAQLQECHPSVTPDKVVSNLAALAQNIYEPLKAQYPNCFMTNSFRHGRTIGGGQHGTGQAADFQFHGVHSNNYYDIAVWMSKNLPYGQLLLEYLPGRTVWIHCSYEIPGLPYGGIKVPSQNKLATLNGAGGAGSFVVNLHADIVANAGINRVVAG